MNRFTEFVTGVAVIGLTALMAVALTGCGPLQVEAVGPIEVHHTVEPAFGALREQLRQICIDEFQSRGVSYTTRDTDACITRKVGDILTWITNQ